MRAFSVAATAKRVYTEPIKLYPPDKTLCILQYTTVF